MSKKIEDFNNFMFSKLCSQISKSKVKDDRYSYSENIKKCKSCEVKDKIISEMQVLLLIKMEKESREELPLSANHLPSAPPPPYESLTFYEEKLK